MKNIIEVIFETDEDDENIFRSALIDGLEHAGTKARIIKIEVNP